MGTVSVSPKFQIVVPRRIREAQGLRPGQKMRALLHGDRVELIPLVPLTAARGFLAGIDTGVEREADRV
jgi:AbrB family looped-hinge helix DNA binding protein